MNLWWLFLATFLRGPVGQPAIDGAEAVGDHP